MMHETLQHLQTTVSSWPGVTAAPHRFGGIEFNLGAVEIGHVHSSGMVDIPFNRKLRQQLVAEHRAEPHRLLRDTGWISFTIRSQPAVQAAIVLFRLSYLFNAARGQARQMLAGQVDVAAELDALQLSEPLRAIFDSLTPRR